MVKTLFEKLICDESGKYQFSLSINNIESYPIKDSLFWISSDILPEMMLEKFSAILSPKLIFEDDDTAPNFEYLEELIDFIGDLVLKDWDFKPFYYPLLMFDSEQNVRPEVTRKFKDARQEIRLSDKEVFNSFNELHLLYFRQLIQIPNKYFENKNIRIHRITRIAFEKCLTSLLKADEYVEIYFSIVRFKLIANSKREPRYYLALNKKNEPLLAIRADEQN